jgi:outer membrane protein assembly factor BamB/predicted esterase
MHDQIYRFISLICCFTILGIFSNCGGGSSKPTEPVTPPPIVAVDKIADNFHFDDVSKAELNSIYESNSVTVNGIAENTEIPIAISSGEYSIDGAPYTSASGTIKLGQKVKVRLTSSDTANTQISAILSLNALTLDSFDVVTKGGKPLARGSQNWPMFGGSYKQTRSSIDTLINNSNIPTLAIAKRIEGAGVSGTPAFVDNKVYFADYDGWLRVVDAETGSEIWSKRLQESMFTGSVFVGGDTLYIAGEDSTIFAVNRESGDLRWKSVIETTPRNRIWSSPVVVGDTLIIGAASYQVFYPVSDKSEAFRGGIVGLDVTTGKQKWRLSVCPTELCGGGISVWSSAAVDTETGIAYIGTGQAYEAPAGPYSDALIAFNYTTGERLWSYQFTPNDVYTVKGGSIDHDIGATPNIFEVTINGTPRKLVGVGDKGGRYMAFDRLTGEKMWERTVSNGSPLGGIMGSAAYADGQIYLTSNTSVVGTNRLDPVPATGTAVSINAATGIITWSTNMPAGSISGNTIANGLMYFTTWDGMLRILSAKDGIILRSLPVGKDIGTYDAATQGFPNGSTSGPAIANGRIYMGYGWTWTSGVRGGLVILRTEKEPAPLNWAAACPNGYTIKDGLNNGFEVDGRKRSFYIYPAKTGTGARPVFVALTGTVEPEQDFLNHSMLNAAPDLGYTLIAPVRICSALGLGDGSQCNTGSVLTQDGRTWEPWFDGVAASNIEQYKDEGTDVRLIEQIVRCATKNYDIDQGRIFIGGISAGGTLTNRALTFKSDFFAGGAPASGEWYRTDGADISVENVGDAVIEGRAAPRPLNKSIDALDSSINIVLWGGETDKWYSSGNMLANYNPSTKLAANYYASQEKVLTVSCTHNLNYVTQAAGHVWPRNQEITNWILTTLASHPKGTPKQTFHLPTTPSGLSCKLGSYSDH